MFLLVAFQLRIAKLAGALTERVGGPPDDIVRVVGMHGDAGPSCLLQRRSA